MRKISLIFVAITGLGLLFSCQQSELIEPEVLTNQKDVYVENGYLVFKNLQSADSVLKEVYQMDEFNFSAWEKSIGFQSARSLIQELYEQSKMLNSKDELEKFLAKNQKYLILSKIDTTSNISVVFESERWNPIINREGIVKVGKSLIIFDSGKTISILDGDIKKIGLARNYEISLDKENIFISKVQPMLKGAPICQDFTHSTLYGWPDYKSNSKGIRTRFECRQMALYTGDTINNNTHKFDLVTEYYVWQKGLKYYLWNWWGTQVKFGMRNVRAFSSMGGYAYYNDEFKTTNSETSMYFCFYHTMEKWLWVGDGFPPSTDSPIDTEIKIQFEQWTDDLNKWIYTVNGEDYIYPSNWNWWMYLNIFEVGTIMNPSYIQYDGLHGGPN